MAEDYLFYLFGAVTLTSALLMVVNRRPVNSVIAMLLTILGVTATFFLLDAPFLATLLLMVYAGAIVVLFLFVVMLIDSAVNPFKLGWVKTTLSAFAVLAILGGGLVWLFADSGSIPPVGDGLESGSALSYSAEPQTFGLLLFTRYIVLVEVVAMLLLGAMAAVLMLHRQREIPVQK
ncbi:MAG: NADH-quinone oxidoreductase subunit J [Opitutales bacterium]|nr:NADH-quinone oxidoreductase subunit J [Opitutales bacterium]